MYGLNKLECFFPAGLSSIVLCFWVRPGAYPRVGHMKGASIGQAMALHTNIIQVTTFESSEIEIESQQSVSKLNESKFLYHEILWNFVSFMKDH